MAQALTQGLSSCKPETVAWRNGSIIIGSNFEANLLPNHIQRPKRKSGPVKSMKEHNYKNKSN